MAHAVTIQYSEPDADPESATVLLNGEPVLRITRGDEQTHELLVTLATHAQLVARAVAAILAPEPEA